MKFGFYTLGCKTNQYETQAMEQIFASKGHEIVSFDKKCDGYIINTCSVTAVADKKNRAVIRRCRKENPNAVIGVCGCYTQHDAPSVRALGVDVLGGSGGREEFVELMIRAVQNLPLGGKVPNECEADEGQERDNPSSVCPDGQPAGYYGILATGKYLDFDRCAMQHPRGEALESLDNALRRREFEILPAGGLDGRTRAMLKVQDGCVNFCSYCIIPYTRGPVRSAPLELAVSQAKELAERGYKEIVVTGIEIAGWGTDLPGKPPMSTMLAAVCAAVPELRIRLGSLEPRVVTREFCETMAKYPNLCPQFHLSMQSGCDSVLSRMKRKYNTARYAESVQLLREFFPDCAITTDMIVAFPGETEEEFAESLTFIQQCAFADMHIFPYSRRPGTPADKMPGQHNNATKEERSRRAIAVAEEMNRSYRNAQIGTVTEVLFEETDGTYDVGHTPNYMKVYVPAQGRHNEILSVKITDVHEDGLLGIVE